MSRVIKFRGYSYAKQSWLYGNLIEKDDPQIEKPTPWVRLIHNRALDAEMVLFGSVGQFTGLYDKNGKEIFEGDFMRFYDKTVAIIVFESFGGWCFKWIDQTYKNVRQQNPEPIFRNINLFEVVGNIHENPELL